MADVNQYIALYLVAQEKLQYENRLREIQSLPAARRLFAFRPQDPFPMFDNYQDAVEAFSTSFALAHPEFGLHPGENGPHTYRADFQVGLDLNGKLFGRCVCRDGLNYHEHDETYRIEAGKGLVSDEDVRKNRLQGDVFSRFYAQVDGDINRELAYLAGVPQNFFTKSRKLELILNYKWDSEVQDVTKLKARGFMCKEAPAINSLYDYFLVDRQNVRIRKAAASRNAGMISDIVPGGLPWSFQMDIADSFFQNNSFSSLVYHDLHLGDTLSREIEHGGPIGHNPYSLGGLMSLYFEIPSQEDFAYLAMMQFYSQDEIRKFVKDHEDMFCTVDSLHGSVEAGIGRAQSYMVKALDDVMLSEDYREKADVFFENAVIFAKEHVRGAVVAEGERLSGEVKKRGEEQMTENERLGNEIKAIVRANPDSKEFFELSDGRRIVPAEVKLRKNGDWEAPIYAREVPLFIPLVPLSEEKGMMWTESLNSCIREVNQMTALKNQERYRRLGELFAVDSVQLGIPEGEARKLLEENGLGKSLAGFDQKMKELRSRQEEGLRPDTMVVRTVEGVKDSKTDYEVAMGRIREELDRYAKAGENPEKAVIAGITGYYCGVKGVSVDSMTKALHDSGITGADANLFALDEYESGMSVQESLEKDEKKELGVRESTVIGIRR